jgi:hypothetical protein
LDSEYCVSNPIIPIQPVITIPAQYQIIPAVAIHGITLGATIQKIIPL